jgi:hypothetical protein
MKILLISLVVLAVVYVLFVKKPTPLKHRDLSPERLLKLVQVLYFRGFDGAELLLRQQRVDAPGLRIVKRIVADNDVSLSGEVVFDARMDAYQRFLSQLRGLGTRFTEVGRDTRFVVSMEFGNDMAEVCRVARALFDALDTDVQRDGYLTLHSVSERHVRIGWTS